MPRTFCTVTLHLEVGDGTCHQNPLGPNPPQPPAGCGTRGGHVVTFCLAKRRENRAKRVERYVPPLPILGIESHAPCATAFLVRPDATTGYVPHYSSQRSPVCSETGTHTSGPWGHEAGHRPCVHTAQRARRTRGHVRTRSARATHEPDRTEPNTLQSGREDRLHLAAVWA